jgi:cytochrome c556
MAFWYTDYGSLSPSAAYAALLEDNVMTRTTIPSVFACAAAVFVGALYPMSSFADDQDVMDYRVHVMKTLGEQMASLGQIAKGTAPAADLVAQTEALSFAATTVKVAFTEKVLGGGSKPEVWDKWDDFSKRVDELVAATADIAKTAKSGGLAEVAPKLGGLSCRSCHENYRVQKK